MTDAELDLVPLEQLAAALLRRVMSAGQTRGHMSAPVSAVPPVDTDQLEQRRARWRRQKQVQRARRTADMSTADTVVVNDSKTTTTTTADMSASTADADYMDYSLPGLARPVGAAPTPTPAPPDDLTRRKLRTATIELRARQALDRALATGTVHNPGGYLRSTARAIAEQQAADLEDAVEIAMARWTSPDAAHVVTVLAELQRAAATRRPSPTATAQQARRVDQPVTRAPLPPRHEVAAGLDQIRSALKRTA